MGFVLVVLVADFIALLICFSGKGSFCQGQFLSLIGID
jgi:hypothetical protein